MHDFPDKSLAQEAFTHDQMKEPEVLSLGAKIQNPNFDPFQVDLLTTDDPLATEAIEIDHRFSAKIPARLRPAKFGGSYVDGVYTHPTAAPIPSS